MGKKSGSHGGEKKPEGGAKARAFVLKVAMHCHCDGCLDKIRAAVKDLTLLHGIETWDQSALETKGELRLVATADPEKLRHRLHKATRKNVDLLFPKDKDAGKADKNAADVQALLGALQGQTAWANHLQGQYGGSWNAHGGYGAAAAQAYPPWPVHVQQPAPYAYSGGYHPAGAAASWGAYAYPPAHQGHGAYGGAWHGHGY